MEFCLVMEINFACIGNSPTALHLMAMWRFDLLASQLSEIHSTPINIWNYLVVLFLESKWEKI